jgi:hypothetical protein
VQPDCLIYACARHNRANGTALDTGDALRLRRM